MTELAQAVIGEAKLIVTEGAVHIELLLSSDPDLELMLCS